MDQNSEHGTSRDSNRWIGGIVPPLVTPLLATDVLDEAGLQRLIEHVIAGGVSGIFILGTTGEAPSLSYRLRRELIKRTCLSVQGRVPVLVGVTDTSLVESLQIASCAADSGAAAVVLSTPYYFPAGQTELRRYIEHFATQSPLPIMLYNMPSLTKVWFDLETILHLSELKEIVGIKDSSGDKEYFESLLTTRKVRPDWSLFVGPEHLTAWATQRGADGGVNGGANVFPDLFVQLFQAASNQNLTRLTELQQIVEQFQAIYDVGKYASRHIKATKCALSLMEICQDVLAAPFNHFLPPQKDKVRAILDSLNWKKS